MFNKILNKIDEFIREVNMLQKQIKDKDVEIADLQKQIKDKDVEIADLQKQVADNSAEQLKQLDDALARLEEALNI